MVVQPEPHRLPADVRSLIADPAAPVFISAASFWEAAIKRAKGRLAFNEVALVEVVVESGLRQLLITTEHALAAGDLPRIMTIHSTVCWSRKHWLRGSPSSRVTRSSTCMMSVCSRFRRVTGRAASVC
jgi:hypothetical protein